MFSFSGFFFLTSKSKLSTTEDLLQQIKFLKVNLNLNLDCLIRTIHENESSLWSMTVRINDNVKRQQCCLLAFSCLLLKTLWKNYYLCFLNGVHGMLHSYFHSASSIHANYYRSSPAHWSMSTKNPLQIGHCPQMKICHLHPNQTFHQPLQALHSVTLVQTDLCRTMPPTEKSWPSAGWGLFSQYMAYYYTWQFIKIFTGT